MEKPKKLSELSRMELKDIFIGLISGHDKEVEISHTLAIFTTYNMSNEIAEKYDLTEYCIDELINLLIVWLKGNEYDTEDKAWNAILDTLNPDKIINIIDDINSYVKKYSEIITPIDEIKYQSLKLFTRLS